MSNQIPTEILLKYYDDSNGGYWACTSNIKNSCIIADGKTPKEALDKWMDLWIWDNVVEQKYI